MLIILTNAALVCVALVLVMGHIFPICDGTYLSQKWDRYVPWKF